MLYVAARGGTTVSTMLMLWVCHSVFAAEATAAPASSCLPASSQAHTTTGVVIRFMTPEQRAAFVQATRAVYEKWSKTIGSDLVKKAEAAVAKR